MLEVLAAMAAMSAGPCQHARITEGGAGAYPSYRVVVCGGLARPPRGTRWDLVIEGGALRDGALIVAEPAAKR